MGDRKRIQRRLRRARWAADPEQNEKSVVAAAAEFGLDPENPRDRERLLHILAEALFGAPGKKGRPRDSATAWPGRRLITLGEIYEKKKKQNATLSDAKIAKLIKDEYREFKHDQPEQIRQRLREAHRGYELYWEKKREDHYSDLADNQDD